MLLQPREGKLRAICQHDHALVSGRFAREWRGTDRGERLSFALVLATTLHDMGWIVADDEPRFDPETGRLHDFTTLPLEERLRIYRRGTGGVAAIHPRAGILVSHHYTSFPGTEELGSFQEAERRRREALSGRLGLGPEDVPFVGREVKHLRFFDRLSLRLCLAPPGARREETPAWLHAGEAVEAPGGERLGLAWRDEEELVVDPFPFRERFQVEVPYRELDGERFPDGEALAEAWEAAERGRWTVTVVPER